MAWNYMSKDKWDLRFRLGANRYKISLQVKSLTMIPRQTSGPYHRRPAQLATSRYFSCSALCLNSVFEALQYIHRRDIPGALV